MAGIHQLWRFDPVRPALSIWAGTRNEGLLDGPLREAWFAQPSGVATDPAGSLWLADAETSALRELSTTEVETVVGQGLFDFGHVDGPGGKALLQHPLGLTVLPDGSVAVADTYNGAVRRYDPSTAEVSTLATGLAEPSDPEAVDGDLVVVESAAHRLTRLRLPTDALVVDGVAQRTHGRSPSWHLARSSSWSSSPRHQDRSSTSATGRRPGWWSRPRRRSCCAKAKERAPS